MSKVDIIIPAYNATRFLPAALDSVVAQTFQDWCILLVDDGSQDNIAEVVAPYQQSLGPKLKFIRQPNAGLPAARNTAIRNGTAEFLALLDADDVWLPRRLEASLKAFEGHPEVGLAYGFVERIDPHGAVIDTFATRNRNSEGWIAPHIYMRTVDLPCPTVTFRRSTVEAVGFFDETMRATEDRDLWFRIAQRFEVRLVPEIIAQYRLSSNAMSTDADRMLRSQLQFAAKHYGQPGCGPRARRMALSHIYRQRAETLAARGQTGLAMRNALRAITFWPFHSRTLRAVASIALRSMR